MLLLGLLDVLFEFEIVEISLLKEAIEALIVFGIRDDRLLLDIVDVGCVVSVVDPLDAGFVDDSPGVVPASEVES